MRVAIILSGQPRFSKETTDFISKLPKNCIFDWYVYLWKTNQNYLDKGLDIIGSNWQQIDYVQAEKIIKNNLPENHNLLGFELGYPSDFQIPNVLHKAPETNVFTTWSMYASQYKCDLMRRNIEKNYNFEYDLVIRYRPDMSFDIELNLEYFRNQLNNKKIVTPNIYIWGYEGFQTNDMFAIGTSKVMKTYFNLIHYMFAYNSNKVLWHPETMLAYHLHYHEIQNMQEDLPIIFRRFGQKIDNVWYSDFTNWQ